MAFKEKTELLFKPVQLCGGQSLIPEYEQRALAEHTKTAKLRELRLAREAELASRPEETSVVTEKLTPLKSAKTSRRARGHSPTRRVLSAGG